MLKEMQTIRTDLIQGIYPGELLKKYIDDNKEEILYEKEKMVEKFLDLNNKKSLQRYLVLCIFSELYGEKINFKEENSKLIKENKLNKRCLLNVKLYAKNIVSEWKEKYPPNIIQIIFNEILLKYKSGI